MRNFTFRLFQEQNITDFWWVWYFCFTFRFLGIIKDSGGWSTYREKKLFALSHILDIYSLSRTPLRDNNKKKCLDAFHWEWAGLTIKPKNLASDLDSWRNSIQILFDSYSTFYELLTSNEFKLEVSDSSRAEPRHFNFRAETELKFS